MAKNKKSVKKEKIEKKNENEFGIIGFTLAISFLICALLYVFLMPILFNFFLSVAYFIILILCLILGLIFSIIQLKRKKTNLAIAGLIIGVIDVLLSILILWAIVYPLLKTII